MFSDDIISALTDPIDLFRKCLDLINSFSKVPGFEVNKKNSVTFHVTYIKLVDKNLKTNISLTIVWKLSKDKPNKRLKDQCNPHHN